jgi:hypothetical protein
MWQVLRPLSGVGTGQHCGVITELEANSILGMMSVSILHICNQICVKFIDLCRICFQLRNPLSDRILSRYANEQWCSRIKFMLDWKLQGR